MADAAQTPCIYVAAGVNGAGKSSLYGELLLSEKGEYVNPDKVARQILLDNPGLSREEASTLAWKESARRLGRAISERLNYAFETTLGGRTITRMLQTALESGIEVRVWYVGLNDPELHISRVRARVATGGHDIPATKIRERWNSSRLNLISLMPNLTELRVYDNSEERDPHAGLAPRPKLILHLRGGEVERSCDLHVAPDWAKPVLAAAMGRSGPTGE